MQTAPRFIGSEIYRGSSYGRWHPLRVARVSTVMDLSRALGWLPDSAYIRSPRARPKALAAYHDPDYIAAVQRAELTQIVSAEDRARYHLGTPANPVFAEMYRRPATAAGGGILAGELLKDGGVIHSPAGGTHHGLPGRANGFCYFNDPVLAILSLRSHGATRVAYVDIDAHHPDGVEHAFAGDPEVLMISTHQENRWPRTGALTVVGAGQVFNLPVPAGFNDTEMRAVREALILPAVAAFAPDAIVLQCGADALLEDPQSKMTLSNRALWDVVASLAPLSPRYLVLGGGGYNPWSVGRAWTGVWATLNGIEMPERLPAAGETLLSDLVWEGDRRGASPPPGWTQTLVDPPREGPVSEAVKDRLTHLRSRLRREI